jgi:DNA polymerase elongation subunit (family B)
MGKVYAFDPVNKEITDYPCREDYLEDYDSDSDDILFHANDAATINTTSIYDYALKKYSIIVTGTLVSGHRANVIITNLPIYFDVYLPSGSKHGWIINDLSTNPDRTEIIKDHYRGQAFDITPQKFLRLHFSNMYLRRKAIDELRSKAIYDLYNDWSDNEWFHYMLVQHEYTVSDWVLLNKPEALDVDGRLTVYVVNASNYKSVNKPLSHDPPLVQVPNTDIHFKCAWDIEVMGNSFQLPKVVNTDEPVFMIGGGIYISTKEEPLHEFCITYKSIDIDANGETSWDLIQCENEQEVILAFIDILERFKPEYAMAFNNYQFDNPFIFKRLNQSHMNLLADAVSKIENLPTSSVMYRKTTPLINHILPCKSTKVEGGRSVDNEVIGNVGMNDLDMMVCLMKASYKKDETLTSNALRSYLKRYQLPNKLDIDLEDMKQAYRTDDAELMKEVGDYCVVDGLSCERLQAKVGIIMSLKALAHLSFCRIMETVTRAGGMKVRNMIWCIAKRINVLYQAQPKKCIYEGKYPGAVVFPPVKGRYVRAPIIAFDYQSLYPSIMRALWISSETYIPDGDKATLSTLKDMGYNIFSHEFVLGGKTRVAHFARTDGNGNKVRGVYPIGLTLLADLRNSYKALMKKNAGDPLTCMKYDEHQKATKILMNTIYGYIGSDKTIVYNVNISTTITTFARKALILAKNIAVSMNTKLIYGDTDSVMVEPLIDFNDLKTSKEKVDRAIEFAKPIQKAINDAAFKMIGGIEAFDAIKINLDKFLYPAIFCGKKKYFGDAWENGKADAYVSGMESAKRGKSALLKHVSKDIMEELKDFTYNGSPLECALKHFDKAISTAQQQSLEFFYKRGRYFEGKSGTANLFIERMKKKELINPNLYRVPQPGEYFEYAITKPVSKFTYDGKVRTSKVSDRWEFSSVVEHYNMDIDYEYYLKDLVGTLARFVNSDNMFAESGVIELDEDDEEYNTTDEKEQKNAKKYLEDYLRNALHGDQLGTRAAKRQLCYVGLRCTAFGKYAHYMGDAYNNDIKSNVVEYTLTLVSKPNKASSIAELEDLTLTEVNTRIGELTRKIMSKSNTLENIYQECLRSMEEAITSHNPKYYVVESDRRIRIVDKVLDRLNDLSKLYTQKYHLTISNNNNDQGDDNMSPIRKMITQWLCS